MRCSPSWGFSYSNSDGRVLMTFGPEVAVPIDFKVVTVHREGDRITGGDSAPDIVASPVQPRARHWRISRSTFRTACVVPAVKGVPQPRRLIAHAGCAVGSVTRVQSSRAAGRVVRQAPRADALLPRCGRVDLVVAVPRR
jgi:hypothetical protein